LLLQGERATGYGVALLNTLFGKFSQSEMLQQLAPELPEDDASSSASNENGDEANEGGSKSKKMRKK